MAGAKVQIVSGIEFTGYGAHHDHYPHAYLTAAAAIGSTSQEAEEFSIRLVETYREFEKKKQGC